MKLTKTSYLKFGMAALLAGAACFLSLSGELEQFEFIGLDGSFALRKDSPANPHIAIVEITDQDLAQVGAWAWPRSWHAAICAALKDMGARSIYFDILFAEPLDPAGDKAFAEAISLAGNVYLPFAFQGKGPDTANILWPVKEFLAGAKGSGSINVFPDNDGIVRRLPIVFSDGETTYPHISLKIAADYLGLNITEAKSGRLILAGDNKEVLIPLHKNNTLLINWLGRWENTFRHYDFLDVLASYKDFIDGKPAPIDPASFKDSICIVALTATGLRDIKPIPIQNEYTGVGVIATAISNILDGRFLKEVDTWINILLILLLTLIPSILDFREKPLLKTGIVFAVAAAYYAFYLALFNNNVIIALAAPLLGLFASYFAFATYNFVRVAIEKKVFYQKATTDGLTGLYNIGYFKILLDTEIALSHANPLRKLSVIMTDVDNFKLFNDTYGHQVGDLVLREVALVLKNSVRSSDVVARYGGEEMIILLRGNMEEAFIAAEKIRKNVQNYSFKDEKRSYNVTISLGVAAIAPADTTETIIKRADQGLYKAKEAGRNRVA